MTETINPLPAAASTFLEVLRTFLSEEDAERFALQFRPYVASGGLHGTVAGLTATPSALTAFPGGFYTTETGSITYADASTTYVIAHSDTSGNLGGYVRVPGTHYLTAVGVSPPVLPPGCVRLMTVTTAGGAITVVADMRELSPLFNRTSNPYVRLVGLEASGSDFLIAETAGDLVLYENTGTLDEPVYAARFRWRPANFQLTLVSGVTAAREQTFPDKDGTFAMLSDISSSAFAPGTRMVFDNDTAPTGWTRDVVINDMVIRIVTGARADGGSWTITGITAAGHTHTLSAHTHALTGANDVAYDPGTDFRVTSPTSDVPSSDGTSSSTAGVSSDGAWRPLHRDMILAEKD